MPELELRGRLPVEGATAGIRKVGQEDATDILEQAENLEKDALNDPLPQRGAGGRRVRVGERPGNFGCQLPGGVS